MRTEGIARFEALKEEAQARVAARKREILVCCGTGCRARGALELADRFADEVTKRGLEASVGLYTKRVGCHGCCEQGPLVIVSPDDVLYAKVRKAHVSKILDAVVAGEVVEKLLYKDPDSGERIAHVADIPFYKYQTKYVLRNVGKIDPTDIHDALAHGAYQGVVKALFEMTPEEVIEEVRISGLRGRGGAGFATARKWAACRKAEGSPKYVLCNGDEGDPGAFEDASLMEGDPHAVLEGMIIGAYAVGSSEGYIYVRDEYPVAVKHLQRAIDQARELGLLGEDILGSGVSFDIRISRGGGAFVCGESSALMRSIEGKVGEPRAKYVHATDRGLWDRPTVLNNVETWATIGKLIVEGGATFASMGTEKSKGTKAFTLVGKVKNTGLIELPMGTTLRHIVFDIGGGMPKGRSFKAVQTGGPSGGCVPADLLDAPVDYEVLTEAGSMMGSGGMIVMDDRTCMVNVARYFLNFLIEESCGKCVPCREGLKQMQLMYDDILEGRADPDILDRIEALSAGMKVGSLCDLGRSAPNPVLSTLRHFRAEYEAHIQEHRCPAGVCRELTAFEILDNCDGCHLCVPACPTSAISGKPKTLHTLDQDLCISCGACFDVCPTGAIRHFPKRELKERNAHAETDH